MDNRALFSTATRPINTSACVIRPDGGNDLGMITFSVPVGTTNGTNYLVISENNGEPGTDPYGHIHGREFTTSALGTYIVGFRIIDLSTNRLCGGSIQLPSMPCQ